MIYKNHQDYHKLTLLTKVEIKWLSGKTHLSYAGLRTMMIILKFNRPLKIKLEVFLQMVKYFYNSLLHQ
jgi:hypothetical protein